MMNHIFHTVRMEERVCAMRMDDAFYGSATIGERGQLVIPAEARAELGMQPGEKVLIMRHPMHKGLMVFKIDAVREFIDEFKESVERINTTLEEEEKS